MRDLLQRHQYKKIDEILPVKNQQRIWPTTEQQTESETPVTAVTTADTTFRQPLPPSLVRTPRMPVSAVSRPIMSPTAIRLAQIDPARMQGLDSRMRLIIQQQVNFVIIIRTRVITERKELNITYLV